MTFENMNERTSYYAHTVPGKPRTEWHPLRDHLGGISGKGGVAGIARILAQAARPDDETFHAQAWWAGLLHDLGKYTEAFQQMLIDAAAGRPHGRVEHSAHGAALSTDAKSLEIAFSIAGHHAGLPAPKGGRSGLKERTDRIRDEVGTLWQRAKADFGFDPGVLPPTRSSTDRLALDLRTRMLFSCLVDADRLDTAGTDASPKGLADAAERLERLLAFIQKRAESSPAGAVKEARARVLEACLAKASAPQRLFSLTVPTGGGKTLSSMAFALKRAAAMPELNRRAIVVIPYLSIIEQNAQVYAAAMGSDSVFEHHSGTLRDEPDEGDLLNEWSLAQKLAAENWNAPVVVTTSVRFFESLFSNRPKDLRRLHNIARSTVILDEVQTLPRHYVDALLSMMTSLSGEWGTTFVFCTATQPAFERVADPNAEAVVEGRWPKGTLCEIAPEPKRLFEQLKRVEVQWPNANARATATSWEHLADAMALQARVLCIVNLKRHAATLYDELKKRLPLGTNSLWHLSTRMCPQHRLERLRDIRAALQDHDSKCYVVSTQLVEAGVDLDFPVVYRAMAPLDAIAQAAGRCDREGRLTRAAGRPAGKVVVFKVDEPDVRALPPGAYHEATCLTERMASGGDLRIDDPRHINGFFQQYYGQANLDSKGIQSSRRDLDFPTVAEKFELIESDTRAVIVPFNSEAHGLIDDLVASKGQKTSLFGKLQRYQVALYPHEFAAARAQGAVYEAVAESDIWVCSSGQYSTEVGMHLGLPDAIICG